MFDKLKNMNKRLIEDFKEFLKSSDAPTTTTFGTPPTRAWENPNYTNYSSNLFIPNETNVNNYRLCGKEGTMYTDKIDVYFFEFSSLDKGCRHYKSKEDFLAFCKEYGIPPTDYQRDTILISNKKHFVSCVPKRGTLLIRDTYEELKTALNMYNNF